MCPFRRPHLRAGHVVGQAIASSILEVADGERAAGCGEGAVVARCGRAAGGERAVRCGSFVGGSRWPRAAFHVGGGRSPRDGQLRRGAGRSRAASARSRRRRKLGASRRSCRQWSRARPGDSAMSDRVLPAMPPPQRGAAARRRDHDRVVRRTRVRLPASLDMAQDRGNSCMLSKREAR